MTANPTCCVIRGFTTLALVGLPTGALAQPASDQPPVPSAPTEAAEPSNDQIRSFLDRDRLTGEWWGARTKLEDSGLTIGAEYIAEYSTVLSGGIRETDSFRNLFTLDAELDLEQALKLKGGRFFVQYLSVNPESGGSADSGDLQVYSNIENDYHLDVIYECWYEQTLLDDRLRIKVGKVEANSEFDFVDVAGDFANSSAGFSPTIFTFPTYPDPAMSVSVFATLIDDEAMSLTLGYGLFDGAAAADGVRTGNRGPASFFSDDSSDDYFHTGQVELTWADLAPNSRWWKDGRVAAGLWLHSGEFSTFAGGSEDDPIGFYLTVEQRCLAIGDVDEERGLYAFAQYGWADEEISEVGQHLAGGVVARGAFEGRADDSAGVYLSFVDLSDEPAAGFAEDEFAVEAYYRVQLTPAVFVQPALQYIVDPSGDPAVDDALVGGLRVGVMF
jgi:porin